MFHDRIDAGEKLAEALQSYSNRPETVVLAIPRGGVVTGFAIAKELNLPLEVVLIKKIGHPANREYAIGAVGLEEHILEDYTDVPESYIQDQIKQIRLALENKRKMYRGNEKPINLYNKTVILTDDGIATGHTLMAAISLIQRQQPRQIIVAVPVGPRETVEQISRYVDKIICLETYDPLYAIGYYYRDFSQTTDHEVQLLLYQANR